eukprot:TRINITY_DN4480_c0_g1_i1.p1 TRINITY_DN4480_c0_g1~~TRINITY_DN4480_c0_g1_i1.p1  ORF type:complete len:165 (+),score=25.39 TRINITY_DN4480_c0_g1_i1:2-496(+)
MKKLGGLLGGDKKKQEYKPETYQNNVQYLRTNTTPLMQGLSDPSLDMGKAVMQMGPAGVGDALKMIKNPLGHIKDKLADALDVKALLEHLKFLALHAPELANPAQSPNAAALQASLAYLGDWVVKVPVKLKNIDLKEFSMAAKYVAGNMDKAKLAKGMMQLYTN